MVQRKFNVPDIPGYVTLKGDFHIHTVFSDGSSWPTSRADEAFLDDLDIIAITDHCDTRHRKQVKAGYFNAEKCDRNASYKIARKQAKKYGIITIHGAEITRGSRLFPGHFNTHFLKDAEPMVAAMESQDAAIKDKKTREETAIMNALTAAREQGAFITWNHPHWEPQAPNSVEWMPIHEKVYKAGLMDGIEIVNYICGFSPEAFHFAMVRNLTVVSGTDVHNPIETMVDYEHGDRRCMTLVFAKERSEASVREALDCHRTAVVYDGCVYGKEEFLRPLFDQILKVVTVKTTKDKLYIKVQNVSSIPVRLKKAPGSEDVVLRSPVINPGESYTLSAVPVMGAHEFKTKEVVFNYYVENFLTDADTPLKISYKVATKQE